MAFMPRAYTIRLFQLATDGAPLAVDTEALSSYCWSSRYSVKFPWCLSALLHDPCFRKAANAARPRRPDDCTGMSTNRPNHLIS